MEENTLLRLALLTAGIGLIALFIVLEFTSPIELDIGKAKSEDEGATVKVSGTVQRVIAKEGFSIIEIMKAEKITVIAYDNLTIMKGQKVTVEGDIKEYKGQKELVADKIQIEDA